MQYERGDLDFKRGSFRVRGDVIDVYPAESSENALRISLFDDEIDRLDMFDPLSGSLHQRVGRYTVFPSSHYVTPRDTVLRACESIKEELRERIEFSLANNAPSSNNASNSAPVSTSKCSTKWASAKALKTTPATSPVKKANRRPR